MGSAKALRVRPISAQDANRVVRALHYSKGVKTNSQLHLGVFLDNKCGGAMQFGPSIDIRRMLGLVRGTKWNEFLELNRLAFADWLPRNGESRCLAFAMRWIKKNYPWIKWIVSFADATQCGDGTIYRASGFVLTNIKKNSTVILLPNGKKTYDKTFNNKGREGLDGRSGLGWAREKGAVPLAGFMLRYIYFLDPTARERLTVPELPFSEIEKRGAGMYKGQPRTMRADSIAADALDSQSREGGSTPTSALYLFEKT
jgi:hypothetical protein